MFSYLYYQVVSKKSVEQIIQHSNELRQNAQVIDELDVLLSFATLASEMNFVRPVVTDK